MKPTALVTGAAGGIGLATVQTFQKAGWETYAVDRREVADDVGGIRYFQGDVSKPDSISELFAWLGEQTDRLDALVNNAAIQISKPILEMTVEEWDETMASNLRSIFLTSKLAFPLLKAAEGAIINVSSVHALATSINIAAYAASKGGVVALTRALALEFGPVNVRVNAILPGAVDTEMLRSGLSRGHLDGSSIEERIAELSSKTVLGRVGTGEEIARAILFMADPQQSSFMSGEAMVVDGGAMARLSTE